MFIGVKLILGMEYKKNRILEFKVFLNGILGCFFFDWFFINYNIFRNF